ncbi:MAG: OmpA family protein [Thermodesulfovibrionales bacterium]|jgi:outer membrane protein OmpA-like peptidoglycan-associated protein
MNKVIAVILCMLFVSVGLNVSAAEKDRQGSQDHPLLTRMPDFYINDYSEKDFDKHEFIVQNGQRVSVEGHKYYIQYDLKQGAKGPGDLKVVRNIQNALTKIGGKVLFEGERPWQSTIKLEKGGKETWVAVRAYPTLYRLTIVEKEVMKQEVEANAEAMGNDINTTGHVSIYGIYFDTGKTEIKPESDAAIAEIAKLLINNNALNVYVVGHTDNAGSFDANMKLSKDRAVAVSNLLISKHGITSSRLKAYGVSSLNPIASNKTEEGKAQNRRVELVEQ